jgi:hypothetical protein
LGEALDHAVLQLFAILVQNFKRISKVIEDSAKDAVHVSTNELSTMFAAQIVHSNDLVVGGFGEDHNIVLLDVPLGA